LLRIILELATIPNMSTDNDTAKAPDEGGGKALINERKKVKRLEQTIDGQQRKIEKLERDNEKLRKRNEELKRELDSARKKPKWVKSDKGDNKTKAKRKRGPKKGHAPNKRGRPETFDQEVTLQASACHCCGGDLPPPSSWHEHWQIDIPPTASKITTRFYVGWSWCKNCDRLVSVKDRLPSTKYGPRLHASVAYWKFGLGLTLGKIHSLLSSQYGLDISTGVLSEMLTRCAGWLEDSYEDIKTSLAEQPYLHADETGWRQDGKNFWLWSFTNEYLSFYSIDKSRGQEVVRRILGESFDGTLIADFYGAYNAVDCDKQRCWVHLLRELRDLKAKFLNNAEIKRFSRQLKIFFHRGVALALAKAGGQDIAKRLARLRDDTQRFAMGRHRHADLKRLAKRMVKYRSELYTFVERGVAPTNNTGEIEIRPAVLMRKTSYGNRSPQGSRNQEVLMTGVRTCAKRGINFINTVSEHLASS
jgi:transposase